MSYNRRFGVELEISRRLVNINYHERAHNAVWTEVETAMAEARQNRIIGPDWKLKTDTSCGGEIVSPILFGKEGMREVVRVCDIMNKIAKKHGKEAADGECGLHIHFDATDISKKPKLFANIFRLLYIAEPLIFSMYPNRNFNYCAPMDINLRAMSRVRDIVDVRDVWYRGSNNVKKRDTNYTETFINSNSAGEPYDGTRYHGFNIHCLWRIGTIEFRYAPGSFDGNFINAYHNMCEAIIDTAINCQTDDIKVPDEITGREFEQRRNHYASGYRFRKYIKEMARRCGFSRETVRTIVSMVRRNNPKLLIKDPASVPLFITKKNAQSYIFYTGLAEYVYDNVIALRPRDDSKMRLRPIQVKIDNGKLISNERNVHLCFDTTISPTKVEVPKERPSKSVRIGSLVTNDAGYFALNTANAIFPVGNHIQFVENWPGAIAAAGGIPQAPILPPDAAELVLLEDELNGDEH